MFKCCIFFFRIRKNVDFKEEMYEIDTDFEGSDKVIYSLFDLLFVSTKLEKLKV